MKKSVWITDGCVPIADEVLEGAGIPRDAELFITVGDGLILLTVRPSLVEKAVAAFERLADEAGISESRLLEGLHQVREDLYRERYPGR